MRGWIPPLPFALGVLSFGLSWVLLFEIARGGTFGPSFLAFAWLHVVALGWISLIALSVLLHVVPEFLDVPWRARGVARACTLCFAAGVALLLAGFLLARAGALEIGSSIAFASLLAYVGAAAEPLRAAMRAGTRVTRAVARAFAGTFAFFVLAALLGTAFAYALAAHLPQAWLVNAPRAHAVLGIGGWLTLLIVGVSARTVGPIAGARSRRPLVHILGSSALLLGTIVAAIGWGAALFTVALVGCGLLIVGAAAYACDIFDIVARATVRHRPPQVLMLFAAAFAVAAAVLTACAAAGLPYASAAIYAALIGWIGSAVLAHVHHIGVRVLLTTVRGEHDETRPDAVLTAPLTWVTLSLYEAAVILGVAGLLCSAPPAVEAAALCGFLAFAATISNLATAFRRARA